MRRIWPMLARIRRRAIMTIALTAPLLAATGCRMVDLRNPWKVYYDPNMGTEKEDILVNFNLHRGRWWNYYMRGTCLLAYQHYEAARDDFEKAIARRSEDKRDARTYGMHFIDYFPNREFGVALYLENMAGRDPNDRRWQALDRNGDNNKEKKRLADAAAWLEASLRQADSSRAKFYLNQARREYLRLTEDDSEGPIIWVKKPIHTNRRTVRFDVTAMDVQSHVAEIRIGASHGNLVIDRPKYLVELAEQSVTRTVEVSLKPGKRMAVVEITALDLVGNPSEVTKALIVLDTMTPYLALAVDTGRSLPDGRVSVTLNAQDDFGLKHIQVGEDETNALDCDGALARSATISALPRGGELAVTVVDCAGNTVAGYVPITPEARRSGVAQTARSATPWRFPLIHGTAARNWDEPPLPMVAPDWGAHVPVVSRTPNGPVYARPASLTRSRELAIRARPEPRGRTLYFPPRLCQETSLSPNVASGWDQDPRSVYQVMVLLYFVDYAGQIKPWPVEKPLRKRIYEAMNVSLEDLHLGDDPGGQQRSRFGVHYVDAETGYPLSEALDKSENEIVKKLTHWQRGTGTGMSGDPDDLASIPIDLVFYGELFVRNECDQKTFEVTLRAKDLAWQKDLGFPDPCGVTEVVADIQGTVGEDLKPYIDLLAEKVRERFPRHHGTVQLARRHWYSLREDAWIPLGENDGMFEGLKLHFCEKENLKRICGGRIVRVHHRESLIKPDERHEFTKDGAVAITE